jgi:Lrp/AsnC ligand binding domain
MPDDETIDVEESEFDETGLHAFLFIDHVAEHTTPEQVVEKLRNLGKPPIMYASAFVGEFQAFAHIRVELTGREGIGQLQDLIDTAILPTGARCTYGVESHVQPLGAKRKSPGLIVLTRIKVSIDTDVVAARDTLISEPLSSGFVGASVMSGDWDMLLQTTGESIDEAHDNVRSALERISGVVRTSTSFADGNRTARRYGRIG